jgi:predicted small metal-binding protein
VWVNPIDFALSNYGIYPLNDAMIEEMLDELKKLKEEPRREEKTEVRLEEFKRIKELGDGEILKIKDWLKEAYRPGNRQNICLFLSGWGAKAGISPISIAKIIKMLHDETGDEDALKTRLATVVYSYKKAGIDVTAFKETTGLEPYGLEKEINESQIKGKSGLQEILESFVGEERALAIIKEIEDIFGVSSPFFDSIFELLDYERQLYAVANLKSLIIARAKWLVTEDGKQKLVYKEKVSVVAPTRIIVYTSPLGGIRRYEITFEGQTIKTPLIIGPAPIGEIANRLRAEGLVYHSRLIEDVLSAIVNGAMRKGRVEIKNEIEKQGIYLLDGKIVVEKYEIKDVSKEELREALQTLNELADKYAHVIERFATAIKWGVISPFTFIYKQKERWIPWLYLFGRTHTGKTTLGSIILNLYGLETSTFSTESHMISGSNIDSVPRLGYVLAKTTFPIAVNEPGSAFMKEDVIETIKSAIEQKIARGKYIMGTYTEIPSLAPIIFTSNKTFPKDDALLRRFIVLTFTQGEMIPKEKAEEFEKEMLPRLQKLKAIGQFIIKKVIENPKLLLDDWKDTAKQLLEITYNEAGLEKPKWLDLEAKHKTLEEMSEETKENIKRVLLEKINNEYVKNMGKLSTTGADFKSRVVSVLDNNLIPWAIYKNENVIITTGILNELENIEGIDELKSLAELLNWEYKPSYSFKVGGKVLHKNVIMISIDDFIAFLNPIPEN